MEGGGEGDKVSLLGNRAGMSVCSVANLVCIVENAGANLSEVMLELREASSY